LVLPGFTLPNPGLAAEPRPGIGLTRRPAWRNALHVSSGMATRHMRFSVSSGGSPDDTGQWPVLPLVLPGFTWVDRAQHRIGEAIGRRQRVNRPACGWSWHIGLTRLDQQMNLRISEGANLVLLGFTGRTSAWHVKQGRRIRRPGLQPARWRCQRFIRFWFYVVLPEGRRWTDGLCRPAEAKIVIWCLVLQILRAAGAGDGRRFGLIWYCDVFGLTKFDRAGFSEDAGSGTRPSTRCLVCDFMFWFYLVLPVLPGRAPAWQYKASW